MKVIYIVLSILLIGIVLLFSFQNRATVTILFLNWNMTIPVSILVIVVYFIGMMSGGSVVSFLRHTLHAVPKE